MANLKTGVQKPEDGTLLSTTDESYSELLRQIKAIPQGLTWSVVIAIGAAILFSYYLSLLSG